MDTLLWKEKSRSNEVCKCTVGQVLLKDTDTVLVSMNPTEFCLKGESVCGGEAI